MFNSIKRFFSQILADITAQGLFGWLKGTAMIGTLLAFWDWILGRTPLEAFGFLVLVLIMILGLFELLAMRNRRINAKPTNTKNVQLVEVIEKSFDDETVLLDGHRYINCKFHNCMFQWNAGPYATIKPELTGNVRFVSTSPIVISALDTFKGLGLVTRETSKIGINIPVGNH